MRVTWSFSISYYKGESVARPLSIGVQLSTPVEVEEIADFLGAEIPGRDDPTHQSRGLKVTLPEDDSRLHAVIERIETDYGWKPSKWLNIPFEERSHYFGVRKQREYTKKDLDSAMFLTLFSDKPVANHKDVTTEQVENEVYVAVADRLQTPKTQFGALFPFQGFCVTESLGRQLENAKLTGLSLEPVVILPTEKVRKPLFKLSSTVVATRSLLPVVNEQGHQVEANTEWSCYLDDGGYQPHEFKFLKSALDEFRDVDIAMSFERTGITKPRAYRWCIVSQRFRQVMAELRVPGVLYAPVRFVTTAS
jgi:hypothetical protein